MEQWSSRKRIYSQGKDLQLVTLLKINSSTACRQRYLSSFVVQDIIMGKKLTDF